MELKKVSTISKSSPSRQRPSVFKFLNRSQYQHIHHGWRGLRRRDRYRSWYVSLSLQNSDTFSKVKAPLTFLVDRHHILLRYVLEALRKQKNNRHMWLTDISCQLWRNQCGNHCQRAGKFHDTFIRLLHRQGTFDRWVRKEPGCHEPKKYHLRYQVST